MKHKNKKKIVLLKIPILLKTITIGILKIVKKTIKISIIIP